MGRKNQFGRRLADKLFNSRHGKRGVQKSAFATRPLRIERFEDRLLLSISPAPALQSAIYGQAAPLSGPQVLSVITNIGSALTNGAVLESAPQQLTIQFNAGESINPATLSAIQLTRTDAVGNVTTVGLGYVGVNDAPNQNQVVVRFQTTLLSGSYTLTVATSLKDLSGKVLTQPYTLNFQLDLGSMVSSVVPQPVTRSITGQLQQNLKEIDVYFTDPLDAASAQNPQLYQLIATNQTADTNDQGTPVNPLSATYSAVNNEAVLLFAENLNSYAPLGTNSLRLRIGDFNEPIQTTPITAAEGAAGTTYAAAMPVPSSEFGSGPQSVVISDQIETTSYDLQWPGGPTDPGNRILPDEPDVYVEGHFMGATSEGYYTGIPTYTYYFPITYGTDINGNPVRNNITPAQEQRTREIFQLFSYYFGVQFEEAPAPAAGTLLGGNSIGVCTGNLYPMGGVSAPGGIAGMGGDGLAVMDGADSAYWGTSEFGGAWQQVAMHEIMHCLGFGHSFDLPADQIMGDDASQGTSELTLPGLGDLDTALTLFRPQSTDIHMYEFTVNTPGTFSAETIAQRLNYPSLLNTELRLFTRNADGAYSALAQNDNYFGNDSYVNLQLLPGTYYVGVSASGNNQYDPSLPDSGMGGTTEGPYELRLDFTPLTTGPAAAIANGDILLSGSNIALKTGSTPFVQGQVLGQVAITGIDATHVPSVAALNGETFQISDGASQPFTFQFVDTSVSQAPQQGNMAIYFNSTSATIDTIRADMVATINSVVTHLVGPTGTLFDGDADGTPGGTYNYWFNVTGPGDNTIFVDKSSTSAVQNGSPANPYQTISAALTAAAADSQAGHHDIVRIEGNAGGIALIDANGNDITGNNLADQETFSVSDGTIGVTFEFINSTLYPLTAVTPGDVAVAFAPGSSATALVASIAAAINNPVYHDALGVQHIYALKVHARTHASDATIIDPRQIALDPVNGSLSLWNPGTTPLGYSPQDTLAYEIGTGIQGNTLADGATMEIPKNVTVMIDAGAVVKLRQANIDVGSSAINIDRSGGAVQVLGAPQDLVYLTSYQDATIGKNDNPLATAAHPPAPGDWGGLVFESDLDNAYNAANPGSPRTDYEQEGIFLDYVNHAAISYGGGSLLVNSVRTVFDPIYMTDTRVTASHNTISKSADAAMSANPNTFQESEFEGNPGVGSGDVYTADYNRVGPDLDSNLLAGNSINGLLVRIATNAGEPLDKLTLSARFNARDLVYVVPENLEIAGNPGGPLIESSGTSELGQAGPQQIVAVGGTSITDGDTFEITASGVTKQFEFDGVSLSVMDGSEFSDGDTLTITDSAKPTVSWTFTFGTQAKAATDPKIIPFNATDDPGTIAKEIASTIDDYAKLAKDPTFVITAQALTYTDTSSGDGPTTPGTVALSNTFTTTQIFTFTPKNFSLVGLEIVGTPGVQTNSVRIAYSAADSPETVAKEMAAAINGAGFSASASGQTVTINNAGAVLDGLSTTGARLSASLVIDPGVVVKMLGSRIEAQMGAQLIAEGTAGEPVIFTSIEDDRYGGGGTFDTTGDGFDTTGSNTPRPGDWGGLYFAPASLGSIDHAVIAYGGGTTSIEGGFASFNAVEIYQATVRLADSTLEYNADGSGTDTASDGERNGREDNGQATVFVRGAQPVIVNNIFEYNDTNRSGAFSGAPVINIDVDSLNSTLAPDWGRSSGPLQAYSQYDGNFGPLVRGNELADNGINGMLVRGGVITTQSVWDDTDIVYVVENEISVPNQHTYGGLRIESSDQASLVVKLYGATAGFTATGTPLETPDRIGGEVQLLGCPGHPVMITSLNDATVGAGLDPSGQPQDDTADANDPKNSGGATAPKAGDWRSILLDEYSNDRNVVVVNELEPATGNSSDTNATTSNAQGLGELATSVNTGDDSLRLGFEVHGAISYDGPTDADTYSFQGTAGTEVWLSVERTSFALDSVMELVDANGNVVARSDNMQQEEADPSLLGGTALQFQDDPWTPVDDYSTNPYDPAMRVVLPGPAGTVETYYVRIYSALAIGDIDAAHIPTGISGITAADVPVGISGISTVNVSNLNGKTFQITSSTGAATFEFIDSTGTTKLTSGDVAIYFNSKTDTSATIAADMVQAINGYIVVGNLSHVPVAIGGITAANVPTVADMDGMQFQISVSGGTPVTFEFVDTSVRSQASPGDVPVFFDSSLGTTTLDTIRANMVSAIDDADFGCTAQVLANGEIALYGSSIVFNGKPYSYTATPFTQVANLDGATFQITDGAGTTRTFEFVDTSVRSTASGSNIAVDFTGATGIDLAAMVAAINGAGFNCTAQVQPDGAVALYGTGVTLNTGTTPFSKQQNVSLDLTAKAMPDGAIALQGPGVVFSPGNTSFSAEKYLENLDGTTFQITDAADNTTTFEFVNVASANQAAATGYVGVYFNWASGSSTNDTISSLQQEIAAAINGYPVIANIDSAHLPVIKSLDGTTFQITDGLNNKAIFEFIDAAGSTTPTAGDTPISFDSSLSTTTLATIRTAMAAAINGAGLACTALVLPDGTIALYGHNVVMSAGTTPFAAMSTNPASANYTAQAMADGAIALHGPSLVFNPGTTSFFAEQNLENLDGTTFQITDGSGKTLTFEFVDTHARTQATAGNVGVFFNSTIDTIDTVLTDMVTAINGYTAVGTVEAGIRGIDASHVKSIAALNGETFQITDGESITRTFEFIDTSKPGAEATAGDVAVDFNSTTPGINMATIRTAMVAAINGANFSCTAQAMPDGSISLYGSKVKLNLGTTPFVSKNVLASLNGTTFQISDSTNKTLTFEFVDKAGTTTLIVGDIAIYFNSTTDTADSVRSDIVGAINNANTAGELACTAAVLPDGTIALYGAQLTVSTGTAAVFLLQPLTITFGCTAQARPSAGMDLLDAYAPNDTIAIYGAGAVLNTGTTSFVQVGRTSGSYQLQVRLQADEEIPGSTIQYANISYATNGIDIRGLPSQSPLLTDTASTETAAQAPSEAASGFATAQDIGNLLASSQSTITVSGHLYSVNDVNWYKFELNYQDLELASTTESTFPTIFDIDYADGLARPDTVIWVFDATGKLIYTANNSRVPDDSGSYGSDDPYLGVVQLNEGPDLEDPSPLAQRWYYVAVTGVGETATALQNNLLRQEPVDSVTEVSTAMTLTPEAFNLTDVTLYVNTQGNLYTVNPFTGTSETDVSGGAGLPNTPATTYNDIAMRADGELYTLDSQGNYDQLDTGNAHSLDSQQSDGITCYQLDPATNKVVAQSADSVVFNAMADGPSANGQWPVYAVGNRVGQAGDDVPYTTNMLYQFGVNGSPVNYPSDPGTAPRLGTNVTPLAALTTGPTITVPNATDTTNSANNILDGQTFTITNETTGATQTYQFECGIDVALPAYVVPTAPSPTQEPAPEGVRNGDTFALDDGTKTDTFQFISGPVLTISAADLKNIANITDGDTFTITNKAGTSVTFELDTTGKVYGTASATYVPINLSKLPAGYTPQNTLDAIKNAINGVAGFGITASDFIDDNFNGRISLLDGSLTDASPWPTVSVGNNANPANVPPIPSTAVIQDPNSYPPTLPLSNGVIAINYLETESVTALGGQIQAAVAKNMPLIAPSFAISGSGLSGRITFLGATNNSNFAGTPSFTPVLPAHTVPSGVQAVPFGAADNGDDIANRIVLLIDGLESGTSPVGAYTAGNGVALTNGTAVVASPLTVAGTGPGGNITGMAYLNGVMYCVSDQGGLYKLVDYNQANPADDYSLRPYPWTPAEVAADPNGPATMIPDVHTDGTSGAALEYITTIQISNGSGVPFSGLSDGPPDVESGKYANMLFATDSNGVLYAINSLGKLQPVFLDGADSVQLTDAKGVPLTGVAGVSFSNIDYNLWHETTARSGDTGRGIGKAPDDSVGSASGVLTDTDSMYFGLENPASNKIVGPAQPGAGNYQFNNKAVYNTYNVPGGAHGSLISSVFSLANYTAADCPTMYFTYYVDAGASDAAQVYISNDGSTWSLLTSLSGMTKNGWVQAVLDVSAYAGDATLRLRFDFSTDGDVQLGGSMTAVDATQLQDGEYFSVSDTATPPKVTTFEFDLGGVLDVPVGSGGLIADKQTFTVTDALHPAGVTFTLNTQGEKPTGAHPISIDPSASPVDVANTIENDLTLLGFNVQVYENRVEIVGATDLTVSTPNLTNPDTTFLTVEGDGVGFKAGNVPIPIEFYQNGKPMDAAAVAQAIKTAMDGIYDASTAVAGQDNSIIIDQTTPYLLHLYGYTLNKQGSGYGPLAYSPPSGAMSLTSGQDNSHEGFYFADVIIGFTGRGEMITDATANTTFGPNPAMNADQLAHLIPSGDYTLEIRRGPQYGTIEYNYPLSGTKVRKLILDQSFDINDRLTDAITLEAPAGTDVNNGDTFTVIGATTTLTFEYVLQGQSPAIGDIDIPITGLETATDMAGLINSAINSVTSTTGFGVTATTNGVSNLVDLFGATNSYNIDAIVYGNDYYGDGSFYDEPNQLYGIPGDANTPRVAGETIVNACKITNSLGWGIELEPGTRDPGSDAPHPGCISPLTVNNVQDTVGGVTIQNNVVAYSGAGGIDVLGDPDPAGEPVAAVPFYRLVNNTIYGGATGIKVAQNASPTILNNIIANVQTAVSVDATSGTTVLGATLYQNITNPNTNTGIDLGSFPISLAKTDPLFVNAATGNFYLKTGSQAIDSSVNSLPDRSGMVTVETSLDEPQSPIISPSTDMLGQLRASDPQVTVTNPPSGVGQNVYIDRGAIDRVDLTGPTSRLGLVEPPANDPSAVAPQWVANNVSVPAQQTLSTFAIQLLDQGTGVDPSTVKASQVTVYRSDNPTTPLTAGSDYFYTFDKNSDIIYLTAGSGVWTGGYTYTIQLNNTATGILDIAGNMLAPNQNDGTTEYIVTLVSGVNFSHAPGYSVAWHLLTANPGLYLGTKAPTAQAYFVPSLSRATDDGVNFSNVSLTQGGSITLPVTITAPNTLTGPVYLYGWIDFNDDSSFQTNEELFGTAGSGLALTTLQPGVNNLNLVIQVPATADIGSTWARFRVSTAAGLTSVGGAPDGEVEDYLVNILPKPAEVDGTVWNDLNDNGAHDKGETGLAGWTVYVDLKKDGKLDAGDPTAITQSDGSYSLPSLAPGTYFIREQPAAGWVQTAPTNPNYLIVTVASGQVSTGNDFENFFPPPANISGTVWNDLNKDGLDNGEPGLLGWTVFVDLNKDGKLDAGDPTTTTAADGSYNLQVLAPQQTPTDQYVVREVLQTNWGETAPVSGFYSVTVPAGQTATANNFGDHYLLHPSVKTIVLAASSQTPTNAASVQYVVTFDEPVMGVDAEVAGVYSAFQIVSGGPSGASVTNVTPSGLNQVYNGITYSTAFTVTVNTGSGDGTLTFNLQDHGAIFDMSGNGLVAADEAPNVFAGPTITIDKTPPKVTSIVTNVALIAGQYSTNAASIQYVVAFSEPVIGVTAQTAGVYSNLALTTSGLTGAAISGVSSDAAGDVYTITINTGVATILGTTGSLQLVVNPVTIADPAGNLLAASKAGPTVIIDRVQSTVSIAAANGQLNPTLTSPILFTVTFAKPVTGFGSSGVSFAGSTAPGTLTATVTPVASPGAYYTTYQVSVSGMTASGNVVASVLAGTAQDAAGNANLASTTSATVTYSPLTAVSLALATRNPTNGKSLTTGLPEPITFTATFSQPVANFGATSALTASQLSFTGSTVKGTLVGTVSPVAGSGGTQYNIVVSGMTATGNIMLGINAGTVLTATGGGNTVSNSASVFYDIDAPVAVLVNPANGAAISTTTLNSQKYIDVAYSANVGAGLSTASILNKTPKFTLTGTAAAGVKITLPPTKQAGTDTYRYYFTGSFGIGTVTVNFIAKTFEDNAGNWNKASTLSFNVMQGLSVNSPTVTKASTGTTNATFTVSLTSAATKAISVKYATANGTAVANTDYKAVSGTLTFAIGQISKTITVPIIGNTRTKIVTFKLVLSAPTNAVINKSTGTCTIDPPAASPKSATPATKSDAVTDSMSSALVLDIAAAWQPVDKTASAAKKTAAVDAAIAELAEIK